MFQKVEMQVKGDEGVMRLVPSSKLARGEEWGRLRAKVGVCIAVGRPP